MYLPGTIGDLIGDLRKNMDLNQKELAEKAGISESKLSRIESSETKNINCDTVVKIAKVLNVSTDYLLGLTTIRTPKQIDIEALGLSEQAAVRLSSPMFKTEILNRLLEHKRFPYLMDLIAVYFSGAAAEGIMARNEIFSLAMSALEDFRKEQPEHSEEIHQDRVFINSQKLGKGEAELEQIKNTFISILKDIRKDMEEQKPTTPVVAREKWQQIMTQISDTVEKPAEQPTADDIAGLLAKGIGQTGMLDEDGIDMLQQVAKQMLEKSKEI